MASQPESSAGTFIDRGQHRGYKEEFLKSTSARELVKERKKMKAKQNLQTRALGLAENFGWTSQSTAAAAFSKTSLDA